MPATPPQLSFDGTVGGTEVSVPLDGEAEAHGLPAGPLIARGGGLSYAAASFGAGSTTLDMSGRARVHDDDPLTGEVTVDAGLTLGSLFNVLAPQGRYLAVQPGHPCITVGGCIAADVHGKNPARDGTFRNQVTRLELLHPAHGVVRLSPRENAEIFEATCGGFGLTGVILRATLQTRPCPSGKVVVRTQAVDGIASGASLLRDLWPASAAIYSWHDMLAGGTGIVTSMEFQADGAPLAPIGKAAPLTAHWRAALPVSLQNRVSGRIVNAVYRRSNRTGSRETTLAQALFPVAGKEIYFRLFGRPGFREHQAIVPTPAIEDYVARLTRAARRHDVPLMLASGKPFAGAAALLRYAGEGLSFAVNVPNGRHVHGFLADMDVATVELGCRPNIIKDSRLPRSVVEACFPDYHRFKSILATWDPGRRFRSELSERLGL